MPVWALASSTSLGTFSGETLELKWDQKLQQKRVLNAGEEIAELPIPEVTRLTENKQNRNSWED